MFAHVDKQCRRQFFITARALLSYPLLTTMYNNIVVRGKATTFPVFVSTITITYLYERLGMLEMKSVMNGEYPSRTDKGKAILKTKWESSSYIGKRNVCAPPLSLDVFLTLFICHIFMRFCSWKSLFLIKNSHTYS